MQEKAKNTNVGTVSRFHSGTILAHTMVSCLLAEVLFGSLTCKRIVPTHNEGNVQQPVVCLFSLDQPILDSLLLHPSLLSVLRLLGEHPLKNQNSMHLYQISDKSEKSSQQAKNPAPTTGNIDTIHDVYAKKRAHEPPAHLESDQETLRLGGQSNDDFHPTTSGETADAKKLAHAPPVHPPDSPGTFRLGSPGRNDDLHPMTAGEKAEAHAPPVHPPEPPGTFRLGDPDNDDFYPMTSREKMWDLAWSLLSGSTASPSGKPGTTPATTLRPAPSTPNTYLAWTKRSPRLTSTRTASP